MAVCNFHVSSKSNKKQHYPARWLREGLKEILNFLLRSKPLMGKIEKMKSNIYITKQILYDMGSLTIGKWLFQRALKF